MCCGLQNETALGLISIWIGKLKGNSKASIFPVLLIMGILLTGEKKKRARLVWCIASLLRGVKALSAVSCCSGFLATNRNPSLGDCLFAALCPHQTLQVVLFSAKTHLSIGFF